MWRALTGSLVAHAVLASVLATLPSARPQRPVEAPIDISFTDEPAAPPAPASPARAPSLPPRTEHASDRGERSPTTRTDHAMIASQTTTPRAAENEQADHAAFGLSMRNESLPSSTDRSGLPSLPSPADAAAGHGASAPGAPTWMPASDEPAAPAGPHLEPDGDGGFRYRRQTFTARVDRDGTVHIHDKPNIGIDGVGVNGQGVFSLSGHFDLTDALMRLHGEDPYRYEKMAFLDSTREERAVMAARDRTERLHDSISALPSYLDHIWTERKWTSSERRAFLFSLWDEAAEDGDDEIATAGAEARATIIDFIRRRVPADGPDAYSPDEVEAFNARRRSKAPFAPYAR